MTIARWQVYLVLALGLFGLGLGAGLGISQHRASAKAAAAQTQSDQHEGAAKSLAAQAEASDRQVAVKQAAVGDADARVATAKRELARLQATLPIQAPVSPLQSVPAIPVPDPLADQLAAAQAVIQAQDDAIKQRDQVISALTASRDHWKAAYDESQQALVLQKIAMDATVHSERSSGVKAQLVRGLEGLALGYAAGRLTR